MTGKRGVLVTLWKTMVASVTPRGSRKILVGEDYNGTKYYEDTKASIKHGRSFLPRDKNDFMQDIPAEWESWLRYRRVDPPTKEEVDANLAMIMMKRKNAAELEKIYAAELSTKTGAPSEPPKIAGSTVAFPTYDDYKNFGQDYQVGRKRPEE